jgi:hypothetical protein
MAAWKDNIAVVSWCLWKERNRRTFDRCSSTPAELLTAILEKAGAWVGAGFSSLALLTALITSIASSPPPVAPTVYFLVQPIYIPPLVGDLCIVCPPGWGQLFVVLILRVCKTLTLTPT